MTIDKKKLVELLVEKTSMSSEEVEVQLDQLVERILDAAKRGKALEIKEFGVFYFDEVGELNFDPADELSTEISFKYAGMKPVELKSERDTSISDIEEDEEDVEYEGDEHEKEEDPFATSFEESDLDEERVKESEVEPEPEEEFESESEFEEEDDFLFDFEDDSDEEKDAGESIIGDPFSSEALEPLEEPVEKEEDRTKIEDIKPVSTQPVRKKDNTGLFILIAIVVIAVLIGGYFYYVGTQSQSSAETSTAQMQSDISENNNAGSDEMESADPQMNEQETAPNQQSTANNQISPEQPGSNQGTEEEIVSDSDVAAPQTDRALYGLMGSVIEEANDGYSIVLHSFRNEEIAMQAADQLRADGYRVIVTSRTVYENLVWRVSVGQFETLGEAQQATTRLPEPYNNQNFIQRIRTN